MLRIFKSFCVTVVLAGLLPTAFAFSLLGPQAASGDADGYQQPVIGYFLGGDIGGPKNLAEEYRWNTPILNYAFDANFLDYFGSNGVVAIEQAIAIMNGVSNLSSYTPSMNELPLEAARVNYQAQALGLLDLKSVALGWLVEELGLASPDRWVWTLRDRRTLPNLACPFMSYDVVKRNYDPETYKEDGGDVYKYSSYINGTLYSYQIIEICTGDDPLAVTDNFPVDPLAPTGTSVASKRVGFTLGAFWTGLTRDDVGGLRYLMQTNNVNFESVSTDSTLLQTNLTVNQLLVTSNLTLLVAQSLTNDANALAALFPGLVVATTTPIFTNLVSTNVTQSFGNYPYDPVFTPPHLVLTTNFTTNVVTWFTHTFANVVTNTYYTNGPIISLTTSNMLSPYAPVGSGVLLTNVTKTTAVVPMVMGDYYLLLSNACIPQIVSTQLTTVFATTNVTLASTNLDGDTNGLSFSRSTVTFFTNHVYVVHPCDRLTGTVGLRQGMNRFQYVRQNYDSLLGRYYEPITNRYTLVGVTNNGTLVPQTFERVSIQPDFLFSAEERMVPDEAWVGVGFRTVPQYDTSNILDPVDVAGPGTMQAPIELLFNKVGPLYFNTGPSFMTEEDAGQNFVWGSYDASTNAPVIYPSGNSIINLENQVLIQVSPVFLPAGRVGIFYSSTFTITGGQPPYAFSLAPGSGGMPDGLSLSPSGVITGVPSAVGAFDVMVRIADSSARLVDRPYSITVNP